MKQISVLVLSIMLVMAPAGQAGAAPTPKDTPLGITFTTANFQNGATFQDQLDAFARIVEVASTVMLVYLWGNSNQQELDNLRTQVAMARMHGLKVMIQLSSVARGLPTPPDDLPSTWSSAETRTRYFDDVILLTQMEPDYFNVSPEVNIMAYFEPGEFDMFKSIYPEIYNTVKSQSPATQVGVSYLDMLWIGRDGQGLPDELGPRDYIGFTTYPDGRFASLEEIPSAWFGLMRQAYPTEPIIFTEVGWGSAEPSNLAEQTEFVAAMPDLFADVKPVLVIWALLHESGYFQVAGLDQEALDFLAEAGVDPEVLFRKFNSIGLLTREGDEKPAWFAAKQLDFSSWEQP